MREHKQNNNYITANLLALSSMVIFLLFAWQGSKGFNLYDEGFLWYGAQRVMLGEVPLRDFMSYDPGRYYWSATLMSLIGDNGIMSLRAVVALFQMLGLFTGILLIAQSAKSHQKANYVFWIISAVVLAIWMFPRHKLFDISLSIFLMGALNYLIIKPVPKRYFLTGLCVGLVAVFGRNHGLYGAAGSLGVILWLNINRRSEPHLAKGILLWCAGIIAGFIPVLLMVVAVPGFASAFWESIRFLIEQKATNLPLPVPWPWTVNYAELTPGDAIRGLLIGLFFVGILVFGTLSIVWVFISRIKEKQVPPALVAAAFLALPYAHYALSRADVGHLALGIFPLLVGCLVILSTAKSEFKWILSIVLCAASLWSALPSHPAWQCRANECVDVMISGSSLQVDRGSANDIALLRQLAEQYAPNGRSFITTPIWPGAYPLLERRSPMWEIFALFPRSESFERQEIERVKASNPGFAVVFDFPLDGRDDLRFRNTHPLINNYIRDNFDSLQNTPNPAYQIYTAKSAVQ